MPRMKMIALLALAWWAGLASARAQQELSVAFYDEHIRVAYDSALSKLAAADGREPTLVRHFAALSQAPYSSLLRSLQQARRALQLNDWLYYQLMRKSLQQIYPQPLDLELAVWFFLSQSGFDTRLAYVEEEVFVFVYTREEVFEAPIIQDGGRTFVNLTDIHGGGRSARPLYLLDFKPNPSGHAFSFQLRQLPLLRPQPKAMQVRFGLHGKTYALDVKADATVRQYMADYPILDEGSYLDVPLSPALAESLLPQLLKMLEGKNEWESVELLAAFTRSAFAYQEDKDYFGFNKPMIAEEVFLYPYSDCEDRCALFIRLVDALLGLPMIVLAYPGHLSVGVALPQLREGFIRHQGKAYYICDPTGPVGSSAIGKAPEGFEDAPFEIIKVYK
jgi:hypothetical protein